MFSLPSAAVNVSAARGHSETLAQVSVPRGIAPYAAGFEAALSNVTDIGLSFGGGFFFENGVGTTDGSGTTLNSFNVSP
jgi:hypothetical protein